MNNELRSASRPDIDFAPSNDERWAALAAAGPQDRLAHIVAAMRHRSDDFVDRAVRRILTTVDSYEEDHVVERDDLWWSVYRNLEVVLLALGEERMVDEQELALRRELGRRRAQQGMPIDDVMRAFRVGYAVLWEALSETARRLGPEYASVLLEKATHVWMTFDHVTSAVASAHRETLATRHLDRRRRALMLLNGLQQYPQDASTTEELCRSLGLDPNGSFTMVVQASADQSLPPPPGRDLLVIDQPDRMVVLSTGGGEPSRAEATLAGQLRRHQFRHIGVGVMRQGLAGAKQSLEDAEAAFRASVALDVPVVMFRTDWLTCLAMKNANQLSVLVAPAVASLESDEDLWQTLEAFLEADGSMTATGKALFVHANTVAYRLRQFAQRTGIDPRTATGMALTQLALTYSREAARTRPHRTITLPDLTLAH